MVRKFSRFHRNEISFTALAVSHFCTEPSEREGGDPGIHIHQRKKEREGEKDLLLLSKSFLSVSLRLAGTVIVVYREEEPFYFSYFLVFKSLVKVSLSPSPRVPLQMGQRRPYPCLRDFSTIN